VKMPVQAAGIRKLPPYKKGYEPWSETSSKGSQTISVPTPNGLPPKAIRADSPPEEPPEVVLRFRGLSVRPKVLFTVSA